MSASETVAAVLAIILVAGIFIAVVLLLRKEYKYIRYLFLTPDEKYAYDALADAKQELKDARAAQADAERML